MVTVFDDDGTSRHVRQGQDFASVRSSLGLIQLDSEENILQSLSDIRNAIKDVRKFTSTITSDINILQARADFTANKINIDTEGADKLTLADLNEESAKLLSLQTLQDMQISALAASRNSSGAFAIASLLFGG